MTHIAANIPDNTECEAKRSRVTGDKQVLSNELQIWEWQHLEIPALKSLN
jgi:hypothetical protein